MKNIPTLPELPGKDLTPDLCSTCVNFFHRVVVIDRESDEEPIIREDSLCMAIPENMADVTGIMVVECSCYGKEERETPDEPEDESAD